MTPKRLRVLFAPETFNLGETSRGVEVARAMRRDGHQVLFMGYSRRFASYVREAGFELELLSPELSEADADRLIAIDQGRALRHPFTTQMVRKRVASELALFNNWRPDVIVIGTTLTCFLSARIAGIPLIYVKPYPLSQGHLKNMREFPVISGASWPATAVNRGAAWAIRTLSKFLRWKPVAFRRVAAEYELWLPKRTLDFLAADLNLIASLFPALDHRPLAANELAVGPIYARSEQELPPQVQALAQRTRQTIYLGLGSSANPRLARQILSQLGTLEIEVIASVGNYLTAAHRQEIPSNVQLFDFLPAHKLVGLVDAVICHGGEGTVQTACSLGVPFAGIGLQTEQRINIDECVRYGNALAFTANDLRRGRLPAITQQLLTDQQLIKTAQNLGQTVQGLDGAVASAQAIAATIETLDVVNHQSQRGNHNPN